MSAPRNLNSSSSRDNYLKQDFISSLLTRRPHLRLTAVASLLHDWLQVGSGYWLLAGYDPVGW